ncbi:actin family [Paraphysoderma sedebokerense]|nr:actin family [Paraphysoderma sedebokerense]
MLYLKEENFVVIEVGSSSIKAGVADITTGPSFTYEYSNEELQKVLKDDVVNDWDLLESIWRQILFKNQKIKKSRNECPVLLSVPTTWTKLDYERITQIFFESFNVLGLYIVQKPLMALYGVSAVTGIVMDVGYRQISITPVIDSIIQRNAIQNFPLGMVDVETKLLELVKSDPEFMASFANESDEAILKAVRGGGVLEAMLPAIRPKDRKEYTYNDKTFTLNEARYECVDNLFDPQLSNKESLSLADAMQLVLQNIDPEKRLTLLDNVLVTGSGSLVKNINQRIEFELNEIIAVTDNIGEYQPRDVKFLRIPEFYEFLRDRPDLAGWIGSSIVSRIIFPDPKAYVTKPDYNESGPATIHTKSY